MAPTQAGQIMAIYSTLTKKDLVKIADEFGLGSLPHGPASETAPLTPITCWKPNGALFRQNRRGQKRN
jgi:hypothetical protein